MLFGNRLVYHTTKDRISSYTYWISEWNQKGRPIIDAYFRAGRDGEASVETADHKQKVLYVSQALNETIYSEPVDYDYTPSNVLIVEQDIQS